MNDKNIYELFQDLEGDIGLLINNVGMGYEHPEYFLDIENCAQVSRYKLFTIHSSYFLGII